MYVDWGFPNSDCVSHWFNICRSGNAIHLIWYIKDEPVCVVFWNDIIGWKVRRGAYFCFNIFRFQFSVAVCILGTLKMGRFSACLGFCTWIGLFDTFIAPCTFGVGLQFFADEWWRYVCFLDQRRTLDINSGFAWRGLISVVQICGRRVGQLDEVWVRSR